MAPARFRWMCALSGLALPVLLLSDGSNPPPASRTGGFGEQTCAQCHTGALNPSTGKVGITVPAVYTPGTSFPVQVTITDTGGGRARWGFQMSARFAKGTQAGTFAAADANTTVRTASWLGSNIQYASHSSAVRQQGESFTYSLRWTAPPDVLGGEVIFHVTADASDGDGNAPGDRIYAAEYRSVPPAVVGAGGVVSAATFTAAPNNQVARGQLISIFGTNLTAGGPYAATNIPLPVQLGPTTVSIAGYGPVPLVYVSAGQINAQLPFEMAESGSRSLEVTVAGVTSAPENVSLAPAAPGIFTAAQNGAGNGAILHADFSPVNANKPARPGEIVLIFCTGLGDPVSGVATGKAGNGEPVRAEVKVAIDGLPAPVNFAGLAPGLVGLYQVNAVVPGGVSAGAPEILITAGGASSRPGVTIPVSP